MNIESYLRGRGRKLVAVAGAIGIAAALPVLSATTSTAAVAKAATTTASATSLPPIPAPPKSLIKAAEAEGKLSLYGGAQASVNQSIGNAFSTKYPGINVTSTSLATAASDSKFLANAQANAQQCDVTLAGYSGFFLQAYQDGYMTPIDKIIPRFKAHYPASDIFAQGLTAIVLFNPNGIAYNTNDVPKADVPTSMKSFASPFWKGHLIDPDPNASVTFMSVWELIIKKYGVTVAREIASNLEPTQDNYSSLVPAAAALAAGEGWGALIMAPSQMTTYIAEGAPVAYVQPSLATGQEIALGVAKQAPDPAAAQLFAYWAYSKAGQKAIAIADAASGPLYPKATPKDFEAPDFNALNKKSVVDTFLGIGAN